MTDKLVEILHARGCTLVVANAGRVETFDRRGVADLFALLNERPDFLRGASVADKVVGKGAAVLMLAGGVASLHADVISTPALALLSRFATVDVAYDTLVPGIRNRRGDGPCPVESLCAASDDLDECYELISQFIRLQNADNSNL